MGPGFCSGCLREAAPGSLGSWGGCGEVCRRSVLIHALLDGNLASLPFLEQLLLLLSCHLVHSSCGCSLMRCGKTWCFIPFQALLVCFFIQGDSYAICKQVFTHIKWIVKNGSLFFCSLINNSKQQRYWCQFSVQVYVFLICRNSLHKFLELAGWKHKT